jgi:hypothetical protein
VLTVLEAIDSLWHSVQGMGNGSLKTFRTIHKAGRAAKNIQCHFESLLSRQDRTDKRSWELYSPEDRPGARGTYA